MRGIVGNVVPSEPAGAATSNHDSRQAPRLLLRRPARRRSGGRGSGTELGPPPEVRLQRFPRRFERLAARVLSFSACCCVYWFQARGPREGPRLRNAGRSRRVGLSASDGLGGERALLGGWNQACPGESVAFPPGPLVRACAAPAALRGRCPIRPIPADEHSRIAAVQRSVLDTGISSDDSPSRYTQGV